MSAILTAIVFIKSVSGTRALSGIATARLDDEEYIDFQYKAFNVSEGSLLEPIQENTIMLFVGKYVFESQLYVTLIKSTLLDLKTLGERPNVHDLPISPLFGAVTGPCTVPSRSQDDGHYFTLSRKTYNPFTSAHVVMDVPCFYEPENGRHINVANATNGKAIFSTAGELFVGRKLVQIIATDIEWTYPAIERATTATGEDKGSWRKKVKSKRLDFEEKYVKGSGNQKKRPANYHYDGYDNNGESSTSRGAPTNCDEPMSTKLADAVSIVTNNKGKGREGGDESLDVERSTDSCGENSDAE